MLEGKLDDMGDIVIQTRWLVKGRSRHVRLHVSAPRHAGWQRRNINLLLIPRTGRVDHSMDLMADKQVDFSLVFTDEMGNPVPTPANVTVTWGVDAPSVIDLNDHGDGTATAAATGQLGQAVVHVDVTADGFTGSGDELITVVPGLAQRVTLTASEPSEVTPD